MPIPIDKSRRTEISVLLNATQRVLGRQDFAVIKIRDVMTSMTAEALLEAERSFDALPLRVRRNIRNDAEAMAQRNRLALENPVMRAGNDFIQSPSRMLAPRQGSRN